MLYRKSLVLTAFAIVLVSSPAFAHFIVLSAVGGEKRE